MSKPPRSPGLRLTDIIGGSTIRGGEDAAATAPPPPTARPPEGVPVTFLATDADRHRLKQIALDRRTSLQQIMHEAVSKWLDGEGLPSLEPITANRPSGRKRG